MASGKFAEQLTRLAAAQVCVDVGFKSADAAALDTLSDVVVRYVEEMGRLAADHADQDGRTEPNLDDIGQAMVILGLDTSAVDIWLEVLNKQSAVFDVPAFPRPARTPKVDPDEEMEKSVDGDGDSDGDGNGNGDGDAIGGPVVPNEDDAGEMEVSTPEDMVATKIVPEEIAPDFNINPANDKLAQLRGSILKSSTNLFDITAIPVEIDNRSLNHPSGVRRKQKAPQITLSLGTFFKNKNLWRDDGSAPELKKPKAQAEFDYVEPDLSTAPIKVKFTAPQASPAKVPPEPKKLPAPAKAAPKPKPKPVAVAPKPVPTPKLRAAPDSTMLVIPPAIPTAVVRGPIPVRRPPTILLEKEAPSGKRTLIVTPDLPAPATSSWSSGAASTTAMVESPPQVADIPRRLSISFKTMVPPKRPADDSPLAHSHKKSKKEKKDKKKKDKKSKKEKKDKKERERARQLLSTPAESESSSEDEQIDLSKVEKSKTKKQALIPPGLIIPAGSIIPKPALKKGDLAKKAAEAVAARKAAEADANRKKREEAGVANIRNKQEQVAAAKLVKEELARKKEADKIAKQAQKEIDAAAARKKKEEEKQAKLKMKENEQKKKAADKAAAAAAAAVAVRVAPTPMMPADAVFYGSPWPAPKHDGKEEWYCICGRGEGYSTMIGCEGSCEGWYHPVCLGFKASLQADSWYCHECLAKDKKHQPIVKAVDFDLTDEDAKNCGKIVRALLSAPEFGKIFNVTPDEVVAPNYFSTVWMPMGLDVIEKRLQRGKYYPQKFRCPSFRAFHRDIMVIAENCRVYNFGVPDDAHWKPEKYRLDYLREYRRLLSVYFPAFNDNAVYNMLNHEMGYTLTTKAVKLMHLEAT